MAGVTVILTDESDHPLLYDITGEDGTFQFNNLPWGTYKVYLDIVGHDPVFTMVTIGPDQPSVDNIHFEVSSEGITGAEGITSSDQIWLAPNPAKDMVPLNFTLTASSPLSIQLFDLSGKLILSKEYTLPEGEQQISLNLTSLEPGIYFIKTRDKGRIWAQKLIKQ